MYILRAVIFSLYESNLTRILTVFEENLVKKKEKRTSQNLHLLKPCSLFFTSKKSNHNNSKTI